MNTHTFGRHAGTKKNVIQFSPNLIRNLQSHYDELKQYMEVGNWNYEAAKVAMKTFYQKSVIILDVMNYSQVPDENDIIMPIADLNQTLKDQYLNEIKFIIFRRIFDIKGSLAHNLVDFSLDFDCIYKISCESLIDKSLTLIHKIFIFIYICHLTEKISETVISLVAKDDICKKRLINLMKSELILHRDYTTEGSKLKKSNTLIHNLNVFLVFFSDIEALINQYLIVHAQ